MHIMDTKKYLICNRITFLPKFYTTPKVESWDNTLKIAEELLIEIINLNKGKARKSSKHLKSLENPSKILKDKINAAITMVNTPVVLTVPTTLYSLTHKANVKTKPQNHQQQTHSNTIQLFPNTFSTIPLPNLYGHYA